MTFALTMFVSALLLFVVQPLAGKHLLPEFGGSALVWNTSMVFFQALLLLGYLYAHLSIRWLGPRRQAVLHIALHVVAAAWLPFHFSVSPDGPPWLQVASSLAMGLGFPFLMISANAPTLQRWYASTDSPDAQNPYRLYAASNVGSLVALLAYPVAIEPLLTLTEQGWAWAGSFGVLVLGLAMSARLLRAAPPQTTPASASPTWRQRFEWLGWAAVPSSLLLGCTTFLTADIAALPLLWVLPLAVYLATFVVAFSDRRWIATSEVHRAAFVAVLVLAGQFATAAFSNVGLAIPVHLAALFVIALAFHQSLVDRRPEREHLTDFYVWMSLGGVVGGAFNALVAPEIFDRPFEYPLVLAIALAVSGVFVERLTPTLRGLVGMLATMAGIETLLWGLGAFSNSSVEYAVAIGVACGLPVLTWLRWPMAAAHAIAIALVVVTWRPFEPNLLERVRSPYGIYRIAQTETALGTQNLLLHGRINHGTQMTSPRLERLPSTYYSLRSPIGEVFALLRESKDTRPVGVVGLGVGTLATYVQAGQAMDFFEIDPVVAAQAADASRFTYLARAEGEVTVHIGDGRKLLEAAPAGRYRLLVLDAYSSDAIPVHLLTSQALQIYMERTTPDGLLLFHVTNGYVEVGQIVANAAAALGWSAIQKTHWPRESQDIELGATTSEWVAVARSDADLAPVAKLPGWTKSSPDHRAVWTDDFANILPYWH